jgi:two-component system CheB/CheR fusion protein
MVRRMALNNFETLKDYLRFLHGNAHELELLYHDILIDVTSFFRDPEVFDSVKKLVPMLVKDRPSNEPLRIWVPGCSSGEEVYSLAIVLVEIIDQTKARFPVQIFASDISDAALAKGRAGWFPESIAQEMTRERLTAHFEEENGGFRISKRIRDMCVFARHNVTADPPFSRIDFVSCRNLLIYFKSSLQKKVISIFHYALKPRGFLMLGGSETIGTLADLFSLVDKQARIYLKKNEERRSHLDFLRPIRGAPEPVLELISATKGRTESASRDRQREADRIVINRYAPPGVIVNSKFEIVQFRGNSNAYFDPAPGDASLHVLRLVRRDLQHPLRGALAEAARSHRPVKTLPVAVQIGEITRQLVIEILPLNDPSDGQQYLIIFAEEAGAEGRPSRRRKEKTLPRDSRDELIVLKNELTSAKEYLQSIIEEQEATNDELKSANEEIQSSNEELQSTNEEMETAKEELQSTNEELSTVNEELQNRNSELAQANNDLSNLLSSVNIPIVMLGNDLRIRRYTPMAERIFNLIPTDIGRPMSDIKSNLAGGELDLWINKVMSTLVVEEHEVQLRDGHWYSVLIRPYRTADNRIDGVVIAFLDIQRLKESMEDLGDSREYVQALVATVREPMLVVDSHLKVLSATQAFFEKFNVSPIETEGHYIYQLGSGQWDIAEFRKLLNQTLNADMPIVDYAVTRDFPRLGMRTILVNARRIQGVTRKPQTVLLSFEDVTNPEP